MQCQDICIQLHKVHLFCHSNWRTTHISVCFYDFINFFFIFNLKCHMHKGKHLYLQTKIKSVYWTLKKIIFKLWMKNGDCYDTSTTDRKAGTRTRIRSIWKQRTGIQSVLRIQIRDPALFWPLGSGIRNNFFRIPDPEPGSYSIKWK
jgi:hypothetical protein